jgi:hypothetical protein
VARLAKTAAAAAVVALAAAAVSWPAQRPRTASAAERALMTAVLPRGERLCSPTLAVISRSNARFGALIAKPKCGDFGSDHYWLRRPTTSRTARWRVLDKRTSRLGRPPGCTVLTAVPLDIRCW